MSAEIAVAMRTSLVRAYLTNPLIPLSESPTIWAKSAHLKRSGLWAEYRGTMIRRTRMWLSAIRVRETQLVRCARS
jgi:hypothetical protein